MFENEADITINGIQLSGAESMTVRVAISSMMMDLSAQDALGDDEMGRAIAGGYLKQLHSINRHIFAKKGG